jgi:hypothetical protein
LTDAGKKALSGAADSNIVQAETALAKGITAQRSGTVVEAMSYYYEAAKFDPSLAEAASRNAVLTEGVTSGNLGQNVRNDIQWRNTWVKTLNEAAAFFKEHPPFEIVYDPALTQGKIDYTKETAEVSFEAKIISTAGLKIIDDLEQGLHKTGRSEDWKLSISSIYQAIPQNYTLSATLTNESGERIGTVGWSLKGGTNRLVPRSTYFNDRDEYKYSNDEYKYFSNNDATVTFQGVDANKITDTLTVDITEVNGMSPKTAGEQGYISIFTADFAFLNQFKVKWRFGSITISHYKGTDTNVVIPEKIGPWLVTSIGGGAFMQNSYAPNALTSVVIPNGVSYIGENAFYRNNLTRVILPANVELHPNDSLPSDLREYYERKGKKAGTYSKSDFSGDWSYRK